MNKNDLVRMGVGAVEVAKEMCGGALGENYTGDTIGILAGVLLTRALIEDREDISAFLSEAGKVVEEAV